jgi:PHD/YefM family antitoxin component YafN of YafNO toxin-antitoxin module
MTSRQFNQDVGSAKKASVNGPVFITDRGRTKHVLLNVQDYERLAGEEKSIVELLSMPADASGSTDFDWTPPKIMNPMHKDADLS